MSIIHMDGFDLYSGPSDSIFSSLYTLVGGSYLSTTAGRFGGGSLQITSYNGHIAYSLPSSESEFWLGFAYAATNASAGSCPFMFFMSANGTESTLYLNPSSGAWTFYNGDVRTNLGTFTKNIGSSGAYHWIEIHFKLGSTTGLVELWIDGNQIINITNVNTNYAGGSAINQIQWGGDNSAINGNIDDLYILTTTGPYNTTRLGDSKIETLKPNSDATPNDGTLTTGSSHYAMVDEAHFDGDTSTITLTNTTGQEELFGVNALGSAPVSVSAVKVTVAAKKSDAGTCNLEAVVSSGSSPAMGPSVGLTTSYMIVDGIFEVDPNTSSPWTYTAVNAAEIGFIIP